MKKNSVISLNQNNMGIIGDNILFNNGVVTAYYILPLANYNAISDKGKLSSIISVTNLINNLVSQRPELQFSLQRISKIIKKEDVYNNLIETIQMYQPDYTMPDEFSSRIQNNNTEYCLLGIDIQQSDTFDLEGQSIKDTMKQVITQGAEKLLSVTSNNLDFEKILSIEKNIFSVIRTGCVRASRDLVFYNYVSKLYPAYAISYTKQSFFKEDNVTNILGSLTQTVEDNFGYFIMHNEGIDIFDAIPQDIYGCILNIRAFPPIILSYNFPLNMYEGNIQVNVKTIKKEEAEITLKRRRASDRFEIEQAVEAGGENEQVQKIVESINIAERALSDIDEGMPVCRFNASILVLGSTKEELDMNVNMIQSGLKDRDIIAAKSLNQATDFIDTYVKLIPTSYDHMSSLQFPLSFQLNSGSTVGEFDSPHSIPAIGVDM